MGVVHGEDVTLNTSGAVGTFANAGPGTGIVVTVSGLVISGADSGITSWCSRRRRRTSPDRATKSP